MFYPILRLFLFRMDPEKTHDLTLYWLKKLEASFLRPLISQPLIEDPVEVLGITFPNRIGLAAGLDKNGACIDAFAALGFGHIEIGTVTPRPQPGNPKPRLFRIPEAEGVINRFGFNNQGVDQLIENVKNSRFDGVLGINIGKNFDTPVEKAVDDYLICLEKVYPYASYITVNISSPNTQNLRALQFGEALEELLTAIKQKQSELSEQFQKYVPILVKIAPDLSQEEVQQLADAFIKHQVDGVIATNTTFSREPVKGLANSDEQGGLSGAPVFNKSTQVLKQLSHAAQGKFPIIGVGGIDSPQAAAEKLEAGASLVQVYSSLIYKGPRLIRAIAKGLKRE
ncbi:quinone-dependent dihydroorotate dehydrogenase [Aliikangiella marina]|uniref:Dihydroorotate dehydrogenase (quinone) n=1 Tax=Aliikangiella marina TaxID=1712262 RepID=A0A545TEL1_9GAMM|nr:quinone-dependent dihydroorotate dehydrogenase [Aliikangiella marina]TQV75659.1 quinone-dependent dihydroorotate dehydrogenase [Aliikangiella marina]